MIMIEHVRTVGFKGFDIDEDIPKKVIYIGRNKSGKSSRAGAIAIALYGHIPFSTAGKRPSDILDSFGKDELIASVTIGGTEFARKFSRNGKGGVSQSVQIDKKKTSSQNFAIFLDRSGSPRIADVAEFMKQSDAKKTDTLFELFPNDDLSSIDTEIETAKEDVSRLEKKKNGAESTVIRLTNSKQAIEIPSGNIAETQAGIKDVGNQVANLETEIRQAETEEAKEKAKEEGRIEGERLEKERVEKEEADAKIKSVDPIEAIIEKGDRQIADYKSNGVMKVIKQDKRPGEIQEPLLPDSIFGGHAFVSRYPQVEDRFRSGKSVDPIVDSKSNGGMDEKKDLPENIKDDDCVYLLPKAESYLASQSIHRIIDALTGAGCGTCAALIVAKQELKKYKEVKL